MLQSCVLLIRFNIPPDSVCLNSTPAPARRDAILELLCCVGLSASTVFALKILYPLKGFIQTSLKCPPEQVLVLPLCYPYAGLRSRSHLKVKRQRQLAEQIVKQFRCPLFII